MAAAAGGRTRLLFITANTGSLFEKTSNLEPGWVRELVQEIKSWQPAFFALHMQEIGGKNYRKSMGLVRGFIQDLQTTFAQHDYSDGRCYLDEEMDAEDRFTALGSLYFCHRDFAKRVSVFDFRRNVFEPLAGFEVHSLNLDSDPTVERKRFPKSMFSEVKWSRKGFMRTRWRIVDTVFDLVNIHLFHDACNLMAVEQSPSIYSGHRRDALMYALKELGQDDFTTTPMFLFGDFNFRLDTRSLIETLAPKSDQWPIRDGNGIVKVEYRKPSSTECILSIGTKSFEHENQESLHVHNLLQFDKELTMFPQLAEWPIAFPPSYPYSESADAPTMYMKTRAPAWCDRVLMNEAGWKLIQKSPSSSVSYNTIGQKTCMGDHKPVCLTFPLPSRSDDVSKPVNGESSATH